MSLQTCRRCGKEYKTEVRLRAHEKTCNKKSWGCSNCKSRRRLTRSADILQHKETCGRRPHSSSTSTLNSSSSLQPSCDQSINPSVQYDPVPSTSRENPVPRVRVVTDIVNRAESSPHIQTESSPHQDLEIDSPKKKKRKKSKSTTQRHFRCVLCDLDFYSLNDLHVHSKTHYNKPDSKRFVCHECEDRFSTRDELRGHSREHASSPDDNVENETQERVPFYPATPDSGYFHCDACDQKFRRWYQLRTHRLIFHAEKASDDFYFRGLPWEIDPEAYRPPWQSLETRENGETHVVEDARLRRIYTDNIDLITSGHDRGRIRGIYNYPMNDYTGDLQSMRLQLEDIYRREQRSFRINFSFGLILRHTETGEYRYFTAYYNAVMMSTPYRINRHRDLDGLMDVIEGLNLTELLLRSADSTKWKKVFVTNINFFVYRSNFPIGRVTELPSHILKKRAIISFLNNSRGELFNDDLCLFRCLAYAVDPEGKTRDFETTVTEYYYQWREYLDHRGVQIPEDKKKFKGVTMQELPAFEECFDAVLEVYILDPDKSCTRVYQSSQTENIEDRVMMKVNLYNDHFSAIVRMNGYATKFCCRSCGKLFKTCSDMTRHEKSCKNRVTYTFPGGLYKPNRSIFEELQEDIGVSVPAELSYYPFFAVYDFESILIPVEQPALDIGEVEPKSRFVAEHKAVCVSICSNVKNYTEPHSIVNTDLDGLVQSMMEYLEKIQQAAETESLSRWCQVLTRLKSLGGEFPISMENNEASSLDHSQTSDKIQSPHEDPEVIDENEEDVFKSIQNHEYTSKLFAARVQHLTDKFVAYCKNLPVLGFNSSKYDLNLIKKVFPKHMKLASEMQFVVKKNNQYSAIVSHKFRFLDISNFLAAGCSYSKFLDAYDIPVKKGYLPYEWIDHADKLMHPSLPEYDSFFSALKGENVLETEYRMWEEGDQSSDPPKKGSDIYQELKDIWQKKKMKIFSDYLRYYADLDTGPFVQGVEKLTNHYFTQGVDVLKIAISAPGVARKLLFNSAKKEGAQFSLFSENEADLYHKIKKCAFGGPSIIFKRYMKVGESFLRQDPEEECQSILGQDCNSMYLRCMQEPMPVLFPIRRRSETGFKPETSWGHLEMFQWLEWVAFEKNKKIFHKLNSQREFRLGPYLLDGWCIDEQNSTTNDDMSRPDITDVYEFHGCWTHGHDPGVCGFRRGGLRPVTEKTRLILETRRKHTEDKEKFIRSQKVDLHVIYECEFADMKKNNSDIKSMSDEYLPPFHVLFPHEVDTDTITRCVENGSLTGLVEVDICVPEEWPEGRRKSDTMSPKEFFSEMSPIFCNATVHHDKWGPTMQRYVQENDMDVGERKLLIGGMAAERVFLATNLLRWYIQMGLTVTKVYQVVEYKFAKAFGNFCHEIADARRQGDVDPTKQILGETCKVLGNASYGSLLLDKTKHMNVKYVCNLHDAHLAVNDVKFKALTELSDDMCEIEMLKQRIKMDVPIQLAFCILQTAKLLLLQFYYECIDYFVDRRKFELLLCDTDSLYFALSAPSFREAVRGDKLEEYDQQLTGQCFDVLVEESKDDLPRTTDLSTPSSCLKSPAVWFPRECCSRHFNFDRRVPGLFKLEASGTEMIALASKTYRLEQEGSKLPSIKAKGINQRSIGSNSQQFFYEALFEQKTTSATNRGFRPYGNTVMTYTQSRTGFSFFYVKRMILSDGVHTTPLNMTLCPWENHHTLILKPERNPLSNDYMSFIYDSGEDALFNCATQMFLYHKAVQNECPAIAERIMSCRKVSAMWRIGRNITCSETWYTQRRSVMARVLCCKMNANPYVIQEALDQCEGKLVVHPGDKQDLYWTSGLSADLSEITSPSDFPGVNTLGAMWTRMSREPDLM